MSLTSKSELFTETSNQATSSLGIPEKQTVVEGPTKSFLSISVCQKPLSSGKKIEEWFI